MHCPSGDIWSSIRQYPLIDPSIWHVIFQIDSRIWHHEHMMLFHQTAGISLHSSWLNSVQLTTTQLNSIQMDSVQLNSAQVKNCIRAAYQLHCELADTAEVAQFGFVEYLPEISVYGQSISSAVNAHHYRRWAESICNSMFSSSNSYREGRRNMQHSEKKLYVTLRSSPPFGVSFCIC